MTFRRSPQPPCSEPWVVPSQSGEATGPSNPCPLLAERGEPGTQDRPRLAAVCRGRNAPTPPGCTPKPALTRPAARDVAPGLRGLGRSSEVTVDLGKPWQGHWEASGLPCIWGMSPDGEPWTQVQPSSQSATPRLSVRGPAHSPHAALVSSLDIPANAMTLAGSVDPFRTLPEGAHEPGAGERTSPGWLPDPSLPLHLR